MQPLVELRSIGVSLGGQPILRDVDLEISAGQSVGIVGPNGSGKTTLLRLIATLVRPSSGVGSVLGEDLSSPAVRVNRRAIGLISHQPSLIDELSLEENLTHFVKLTGFSMEGVDKSFSVVGLEKARHLRVSAASYGMKRRLEVAWLLIAKPQLLLLDEAKSGLDDTAQELIDALVTLTIERGGSVVSVSHNPQHLAGSQFGPVRRLEQGRIQAVT